MRRRIAFALVVTVFLLDQVLKWWLLGPFALAVRGRYELLPFFDLVLVWNRGISYGLFPQESEMGRYLLIALMLAITAFLFWQMFKGAGRLAMLAYALVAGGALGNVLDRIVHGAVVDYALIHWGDFAWYVFNLADVAIVAGVLILVYDFLLRGNDGDGKSGASA